MNINISSNRLLSYKEARIKIGKVGRTKFYELLDDPNINFPRPSKIGRRRFIGELELDEWILSLPRVEIANSNVSGSGLQLNKALNFKPGPGVATPTHPSSGITEAAEQS